MSDRLERRINRQTEAGYDRLPPIEDLLPAEMAEELGIEPRDRVRAIEESKAPRGWGHRAAVAIGAALATLLAIASVVWVIPDRAEGPKSPIGAIPLPSDVAVEPGEVGTIANPIKLSAPFQSVEELHTLIDGLQEVTGLRFEVEELELGQEGVTWMCDTNPDTSMRVMTSAEFVFANDICGAGTDYNLIRFGLNTFATQFLVPVVAGFEDLADLDGVDWYFTDTDSMSGYIIPLGMLNLAGVVVGSENPTGSFEAAVQAVCDGVGFASVFADARTSGCADGVDPFEVATVLIESPPMPNDVIAFGPDFPGPTRRLVEEALRDMAVAGSPGHEYFVNSLGTISGVTGLARIGPSEFTFMRRALYASEVFDWN